MGLSPRAIELLRVVHETPGVSRADAARAAGVGTGAATELVAQLVAAELIGEAEGERTGGRGRPSPSLVAHPSGPLVIAVSITHEAWLLRVVQLGGESIAALDGEHAGRDAAATLAEIADAVRRVRRRFGARVRAIGVAAPGTVTGTTLGHATARSWRGVDLRAIWPRSDLFVAGNDATLAAAAESTRGAGMGADIALHVRVQAGLGGAVVDHGRVLTGAHGFGGEFGHLPFGDPDVRCPCGAHGCWGTAVDGAALATLLGRGEPRDPVAFVRRMARRGPSGELDTIAGLLGRGLAGLVNAVDPQVVVVGGSGVEFLRVARDALLAAYEAGLMDVRRSNAPPVLAAELGEDGPIIGAAELAWTRTWAHLSA